MEDKELKFLVFEIAETVKKADEDFDMSVGGYYDEYISQIYDGSYTKCMMPFLQECFPELALRLVKALGTK